MASFTLTQVAQAAAQYLGVLDSGEGLSTQQLNDALAAANDLLDNWTSEQVQTVRALLVTFTLLNTPTFTPGAVIQFPDLVTATVLPIGYGRALKLALAIELAPQYAMPVTQELFKNLQEARSAASILAAKLLSGAPQANLAGDAEAL